MRAKEPTVTTKQWNAKEGLRQWPGPAAFSPETRLETQRQGVSPGHRGHPESGPCWGRASHKQGAAGLSPTV